MTTALEVQDMMELDIARLTAENERLRAEVKALAFEEGALKRDADALRLDLSRLTTDAAAECGRLRAAIGDAMCLLSTLIGTEADAEGAIELQVAELRALAARASEVTP